MSKIPYYQKLREFRKTDIRYIGAGGFITAQKEFGKNVDSQLRENIWNIPKKEKIYLEYVDQRYKNQRDKGINAKKIRKEEASKNPQEYENYKNDLLRLKFKYTNEGLNIRNIPKKWPEFLIEEQKTDEEKEIEKNLKYTYEEEIIKSLINKPLKIIITTKYFNFTYPPNYPINSEKYKDNVKNFFSYENLGHLKPKIFKINDIEYKVSSITSSGYYKIDVRNEEGSFESYNFLIDEKGKKRKTTKYFLDILLFLNFNDAYL